MSALKYGSLPTFAERMVKAKKADYEHVKTYRSKNSFAAQWKRTHYQRFYHPICGERCLECEHGDCVI